MKRILIFSLLFLMTASLCLAATVNRNMASRVDPGSEVTVTLSMSGAVSGEGTAIEDTIPDSLTVKSWDISGSTESKDAVDYSTKPSSKDGFTRHSWAFTASSGSPSITYTFDAPGSETQLSFDVRWITSDGFSHKESSLDVRSVVCGDGRCETGENSGNCEQDCPKPAPPAPSTPAVSEPEAKKGGAAGIIIALIALVVIIAGIVIYNKKNKK